MVSPLDVHVAPVVVLQDVSKVYVSGETELRALDHVELELGFVFQSFNLLPRTSAVENVEPTHEPVRSSFVDFSAASPPADFGRACRDDADPATSRRPVDRIAWRPEMVRIPKHLVPARLPAARN